MKKLFLLTLCVLMFLMPVFASAEVNAGDIIIFGAYEQDGDTSNGKEAIEWLVLDYDAETNRALVISKYALDAKAYNDEWAKITWETCTLRAWLNEEFMNAAFNTEEQQMIPTVTVNVDKNPDFNITPGNATQDKVFLLSITEADRYFTDNDARMCVPTKYAAVNLVVWGNGNCGWWLRTPGCFNDYAADVSSSGLIDNAGFVVYDSSLVSGIRPAMWIDLSLMD